MSTSSVLRALSALAPAPTRPRAVDPADLVWLGVTAHRQGAMHDPFEIPMRDRAGRAVYSNGPSTAPTNDTLPPVSVVDADGSISAASSSVLADLASRSTLAGRDTVGVSWMTFVGRPGDEADGPLTIAPVLQTEATLIRSAFDVASLVGASTRTWSVHRRGRWRLGDRLEADVDPSDASGLLDAIPWCGMVGYPIAGDSQLASSPTLQAWIRALGRAAGWSSTKLTGRHPATVARSLERSGCAPGHVTVCIGFAVLPPTTGTPSGSAAALAAWAERAGIESTAFDAAVRASDDPGTGTGTEAGTDTEAGNDTEAEAEAEAGDLVSHVQLTAAQRRVARSARHRRITVVSGAPGTGKTHTIAAICADAVSRGESVLIATRSIEAATVVGDQLARQPGPVPLRFGSPDALHAAFAEIGRRLARHESGTRLASQARAEAVALTTEILDLLATLAAIEAAADPTSPRLLGLRRSAPGCFAPGADPESILALVERARTAPGLLGTTFGRSRRRAAAERDARSMADTTDATVTLETVADAARTAAAQRRGGDAAALARRIEATWPAWEAAEQSDRHWTGKALDDLVLQRISSRSARGALSTIDTALRSGPSARRRLISSIDRRALRDAAPVWLGTLGDVERLLPPEPGIFDLVVIDEASQVDLALAAPTLLRGRRCVVLGDPQQLRHVSFVGDAAMQDAFDSAFASAPEAPAEVARLDVRRNSLFDIAAGAAPVDWLDEHHRSLPHLVQFSLDEFYDRAVTIATRTPTTEQRDCIDVIVPTGDPVRTVVERLRELHRSGAEDVGVVTPLRELADRLQEAVLDALGHDAIATMRLMVTTVHGFQGAERRHVVVVPGVDETSPAGRRRFVEDRHLFNVMVSRARQRMDLVTSVPPDDATLLGRFVAWADHPPAATPAGSDTRPAALALAKALRDAGRGSGSPVEVLVAYPVGRHTVDVVVRSGERFRGVMCGVHPDGPDAHLERHLALRQAGWTLVDLVAAIDDTELTARAIEIVTELRS